MEENKEKVIKKDGYNQEVSFVQKLVNFNESFFKKVDEKSGVFYFFIAITCFLIFIISLVYFFTKVKFNSETKIYSTKSAKNIYELKLEYDTPYINDFISDTEEINLKKENELSSLVYTEISTNEDTGNVKFNVNLPKINISPEIQVKEIEVVKNKLIDVNNRLQTIRTVFKGNNKLNFSYYAYYYQNTLSFGYSYYENFMDNVTSDNSGFVYDVNKNKILTFNEYLKLRNINEEKLSTAIKEIIRREKLKYKYNKKTKNFYIDSTGIINLMFDEKVRLRIEIK